MNPSEIDQPLSGDPLPGGDWTQGQRRIFESAVDVFAEKGFAAATTGEIAKRAGVAEALLFKYFGNKRNLLKRIALPILDYWFAPVSVIRLRRILSNPSGDMRDFLTSVLTERRDFIRSHKPFVRIVLQEAMIDPEMRQVLARNFKERIRPIFAEAITSYQKRGVLKPIPAETILRMIVSSFAGYIFLTEFMAPDESWDHESEAAATIDILLQGIAAAPASSAGSKRHRAAKAVKKKARSKGGRR
ncbi:MAG: TetR/AcrR family transcriptional regulator [Spirochaetia bacterium]|nr:TetR/AcrR family transcriptional regulator [Spirochaetia bacterium]